MTRSEIKDFILDGVNALNHPFGRGRISEFNSSQIIGVWQETAEVPTDVDPATLVFNHSWNIILHVAKKDDQASSADEYEDIIDEASETAQKLMSQYVHVLEDSNKLRIESFNQAPFIKKHASCITGVVLTFTIIDQDTTSYCP